ncbi:hypothetical protein [Sporomusa acidovorans]|uniref:Uncharacterized protein n=1 Tax=Sporomusa acidovorans (strain ATCC 49682 / DSM 3132 / Mol) TaxID=1123286 RepID=A0ABZ3JB47_SPOA4|nr:hypothetical protein [Sporomusa acidovorans]OZC18587.1 hypothetical protein SPACI_33080 [Sporomusa acidovorans DSM 3132]SDF52468.1 hypothetical protein SAMN04488499_105525 [Sporomusa acidovorans]
MEYGKLPVGATKPIKEFLQNQEEYFISQHGKVVTRKATADDIARIEAEIAAKKSNLTIDLCGEIKKDRNQKKRKVSADPRAGAV